MTTRCSSFHSGAYMLLSIHLIPARSPAEREFVGAVEWLGRTQGKVGARRGDDDDSYSREREERENEGDYL